jgi:tetratricopeptide (TPR) repeat protein
MKAQKWDSALGAYEVLLGLNPDDPAGTHFNLARAWLEKGDRAKAKRATLKALEIAPMFEPAQALLLKLSKGEPHDPE